MQAKRFGVFVRLIAFAVVAVMRLSAQGDRGEITGTVTDATGATRQLTTPPIAVSVASILPPAGSPEPRPLKPQAEIARVGTPAWAYEGSALAIIVVVLFSVFWLRRRRASRLIEPEPDQAVLSPEDLARLALDRDAASHLAARDYPAFYSVLAATMRRYLTQRP